MATRVQSSCGQSGGYPTTTLHFLRSGIQHIDPLLRSRGETGPAKDDRPISSSLTGIFMRVDFYLTFTFTFAFLPFYPFTISPLFLVICACA